MSYGKFFLFGYFEYNKIGFNFFLLKCLLPFFRNRNFRLSSSNQMGLFVMNPADQSTSAY